MKQVIVWLGRLLGPLLAVAVYVGLPGQEGGLSQAGRATAAVGTLMAVYWLTEAMPLAVTALFPIVFFPLLEVLPIRQATAPYAREHIFLFLSGFFIAAAIEHRNLHRRMALLTLRAVGTRPRGVIAGFMISTAFLSMWISNTASTVIMLPIAMSVIALIIHQSKGVEGANHQAFATCLMLGIAYAASIGGAGSLIGTPTNLVLASFVKSSYGIEISFAQWFTLGLPFAVVFLSLSWWVMTRWIFPIRMTEIPGGRALIQEELRRLGPMNRAELSVLIVFVLTALTWVFRQPLTHWQWLTRLCPPVAHLHDTIIGLIGAFALFAIPVNLKRGEFVLNWPQAVAAVPWGVFLLFGGGLSLASAFESSGLSTWIGVQVGMFRDLPPLALILIVTIMIILLTELTSNVATLSAFCPVLGGIAVGMDMDPLLLLIPGGLAASCAFMMPVATPPNAIVYSSGHITIPQMAWAGWWLNVIGVVLIPILAQICARWGVFTN